MSMSVDQAFERFPELGRQRLMEYTGISEHEARIQCRFHKGKKMLMNRILSWVSQ